MSFNSFLLTSMDPKLSTEVCSTSQPGNEFLPVVIEIKIEETDFKWTPFISLDHLSYNSQSKQEILFAMSSVFRIVDIVKNQNDIWQVQLPGLNSTETSLGAFIALMRMKSSKEQGWNKLGQLMISLRELKHAEEFYKTLLQLTDIGEKRKLILFYNTLATIKNQNGSYEEAHVFLKRKFQIQQVFST